MTHPKPDLAALKAQCTEYAGRAYRSIPVQVDTVFALIELAEKAEAAIAARDEAREWRDHYQRDALNVGDCVTALRAERDTLKATLEAAEATFEDEQAAHLDTLRLLELREAELAAIKSAITDPENQPSQYGTVTLAWHEAEVAGARARTNTARERER